MDSLKEVLESILFVAGEAIDFEDIASKLNFPIEEIVNAAKELQKEKEDSFSGIQVQIFNNKAQLCSNPNYAEFVTEVLNPIKEKALTKAVLEAAAIIAYKQPITRLEIEHVRGVSSDYAVNVLIENNLIEIVGRKDAIGKPLLYGTTDLFLKRFNIESIESLPDYEELLNRIKIIKNPENTLFDFSNIPPSDKEPEELTQEIEQLQKQEIQVLQTEEVVEDELTELEKEVDKETIHAFFNTLKTDDNVCETKEQIEENKEEISEEELTSEENKLEINEDELISEESKLEIDEEDINYQNLVSILDSSKEMLNDSDLL